LKYSLSAKEAQNVLKSSKQFKTKNISFKYIPSASPGLAFSVSRKAGPAVLRNKFKRQSRSIFLSSLFKGFPLFLLVRPRIKITKQNSVFEDFSLLKNHLKKFCAPTNYND